MVKLKFVTSAILDGLSSGSVQAALLQKQYFPCVKRPGEELPPLFNSEGLTIQCAKELRALPKKHHSAAWVESRFRRFDGLVRRFGIPHPVPYARLVLHIGENWIELAGLLGSSQSQIKPAFHLDGRIILMNYGTPEASLGQDTRLSHGMNFLVKSDISNCFPSIYSHSLDWATRGKKLAKEKGGDQSWQARLDTLVRNCHDRETKGLMIGPAVSNILAELVLQRVDEIMDRKGHRFIRFIDDYTSYCRDRSEAECFVVDLQHALAEFRLDLNTRKTRVSDLRHGVGEPWMAEVRSHLPAKVTPLSAARFLRHCELLAVEYPMNSLLKFAVKTLRGLAAGNTSILVVDEILRLCAFHPHLAPLLAAELEDLGVGILPREADRIALVLSDLMVHAAARAETDVVLWYLYIIRHVLRRPLKKEIWRDLLAMNDELVIVALAVTCPRSKKAAARQVLGWEYSCEADRQQHWLSRYEFSRVGLIREADLSPDERAWMAIMRKNDVRFTNL